MSLFKAASTVSLLTLASRILGLVRDLLMASMFGANVMTDAFNVAFRIPNLFRRLFAEGAFSQAFVPVLATHKAQHGDESTHTLITHVATVLFWALLVTCILGVVGAPVLVWLLASGLRTSPGGMDAAVVMTRWMFPYIGFMSLVALSAGVLNTWRRFAVSALTPVLLNVSMIAAAVIGAPLFKRHGIEPIYAMVGGVMIGGILQLAVQIPALARLGLMPRIGMGFKSIRTAFADVGVHRILKLMGPALLGVGVAQISLMINTQIASYLEQGSVTWLFYADRLMEFPTSLLGVALGVVLTSQLAIAKASGDSDRYSGMLDWGLRIVVLLSVPCAIGLLFFAKPLVATLFHYGALTDRDVQQVTVALQGYGIGLLGLVAVKVLAPGYYAAQDIRTPVKIAIAVLVITQLLNLLFVPQFAHAGLALSIGLGALVNAAWLLVGLLRRGSFKPVPGWRKFLLQVAAASVLLAVFLWWGNQHFDWIALRAHAMWRVGLLAALLIGSMVVYFGALWAVRMNLRQVLRR
ncbi:murein biosynthesis integral membrane protein MurJ [Diaphorobacter sp. HDW4A]|uniref:murein biosynthesis integral membrane protein MurJ n=1 Tax=Diaphorobacter sp. HDW4A TaxID=2714924 RepID=UPI00140E6BFA|nr:murein biosynthesis integral membrane protein MurJ [Diaphorobacter sp. HDW4A]QIL81166.1 murein biosynthesis integral membrane protein MurJ [Diaphorobacter sp. HDW4A]